jgi:hypothetical protein
MKKPVTRPAVPPVVAFEDAAILRCEIVGTEAGELDTLAEVAAECARELGYELVTAKRLAGAEGAAPTILLQLPLAAIAPRQGRVWCLACRLSTYCRRARISVEVSAQDAFCRQGRTLRGLRKRRLRAG